MYQPKLNLHFDPPIQERDELDSVLNVLHLTFPSLVWYGDDPLLSYNPLYGDDGEFITFLTIGYFPEEPDKLTYTTGEQVPENYSSIDGYQWCEEKNVDYDNTSNLFDSLNESLQEGDSVVYEFSNPVDKDLWPIVAKSLRVLYPDIVWNSGSKIEKFSRGIGELYGIKVTKDVHRHRVAYSDEKDWYTDMGYGNIQNGDILLNGDYDETFGLFDSLNESEESPNMPEDRFVLKFDPPITHGEWHNVARLIEAVYPGLKWREVGRGEVRTTVALSDYNPIYRKDDSLTYLYIGPKKSNGGFRRILWDTQEHPPVDGEDVIDGWKLINVNDTYDMFDSLNESLILEGDRNILQLGFDPPLYQDNPEWPILVETLNRQYPGIKWSSGKPMTVGYFPANFYYVLEYSHWEGEAEPCVTYTDDPDDLKAHGVINGYKWIEDNSVNYDETSNLFDSLNESYMGEQPEFKVGDRVYLSNKSEWFGDDGNPDSTDIIGVIISIDDVEDSSLPIRVRWPHLIDGLDTNSYSSKDLIRDIDYDSTFSLFDSINESEGEEHKPKLSIYFEKPLLSYDELYPILRQLNYKYPDLKWYDGDGLFGFNPFKYFEEVWAIYIGYFREEPNRLTFNPHEEDNTSNMVEYNDWVKSLINFDSENVFNSLYESEEKDRYTLEDLEFFYKNKTPFYEISPRNGVPFPLDKWHKQRNMKGDEIGYHSFVGMKRGYYDICWDEAGKVTCLGQGPNELIKNLNSGRLIPVEIYNSNYNPFDYLNEN